MKSAKTSLSFLCLLFYLSIYMNASAQSFSNDNLIIELQQTTPTPISISPSIAPKKKQKSIPPTQTTLSFSQQFLSFGFLIPGEPLLRNDHLTMQTTNSQGATLFLIQDRALSAESTSITDTSCDSGSCTSAQASTWTSPLTFGFGVRCENSENCLTDFKQPDSYRPLSTTTPAPFVKTAPGTEQVSLLYKINIPASQPPLPYSNTIQYILVPNL